jgi:uncharacterized protein (DUF1501 family)
MADCCSDFSRSQFLRRTAAATAGRGLPAIEPGMPLPAGTGLSRRSFLLRSAGVALSIYGAQALGPQAIEAGVAEAAAGPAQPVLVSIFMPGGADSLSILAPLGDPRYQALRPSLALSSTGTTPFAEDTRLAWAPAARGLATLHGEGKVSVMPAIGYDHPDQSHFTSRHYWEVGELNAGNRVGWMGRYLDQVGTPNNPLQGLSLDDSLGPSLATKTVPVAAVSSPEDYTFDSPNVWNDMLPKMREAIGAVSALDTPDPILKGARAAQTSAHLLGKQLAPFSSFTSPVAYPDDDFSHQLAGLAAMIGAGLPVRCVTANAPGGYDTHNNQASSLANNVKKTVDAVVAFQRDLESRGIADRVLTQVWSEFGRRPEENGSNGTDHGAGGASFIIGTRAKGTMIGEFPGLATLDAQDNLRATSDFRAVYCSLLEQWLSTDAASVIPGASSLARPVLVK